MTAPTPAPAHPGTSPALSGRRGFTLPVWGWAVVVGVLFMGGYYVYKSRKAAAASTSSTAATGTPATATGYANPTTILPIFQGSTPGTSTPTNQQFQQLQAANPPLPDSVYTVKGTGAYQIPTQAGGLASNGATINDQWPAGAIISAYNLSPADLLNISVYSALLMMMNPGLTAPYPVGTQLRMPYNGTVAAPNTVPDPNSIKPQNPQSAEVNQAFGTNNATSLLSSNNTATQNNTAGA